MILNCWSLNQKLYFTNMTIKLHLKSPKCPYKTSYFLPASSLILFSFSFHSFPHFLFHVFSLVFSCRNEINLYAVTLICCWWRKEEEEEEWGKYVLFCFIYKGILNFSHVISLSYYWNIIFDLMPNNWESFVTF